MATTTTELNLAELRQENMSKVLNQLQNHASSILSLTHQWKEIEDGFQSTESAIEERAKELHSMELSILVQYQQLEVKEKEFEIREKGFELRKNSAVEEQCKVIEWIVETSKEVRLTQELLRQHMEELEEKKKKFELINKEIDEEIERKNKRLKLQVEVFKKDVEEFEEREKRFEQRVEEFRLAKKQFKEITNDENFQERCKVLNLKEKELEERLKEVEFREKQLEERCKEVEYLKEKEATATPPHDAKSSCTTIDKLKKQQQSHKETRHPEKLRRGSRNIRPYNRCSMSCCTRY